MASGVSRQYEHILGPMYERNHPSDVKTFLVISFVEITIGAQHASPRDVDRVSWLMVPLA